MKVYVVTKHFKNPRYCISQCIYQGVHPSEDDARRHINFDVEDYAPYFDSVITGEFTADDGTVYIEGRHRNRDQYFCYAIREEEV